MVEQQNKEKKDRLILVLLFGVVVVLLVGSIIFLVYQQQQRSGPQQGDLIASIWVDGVEHMTLNLTTAEDQEFSIAQDTGRNVTFQVKDHAICFLESDCPDQLCVLTGWIKSDYDIAACLPNGTVLMVETYGDG